MSEGNMTPGRTFTRSDGSLGCDECCTGDRCDDPTHRSRESCPFCLGSGTPKAPEQLRAGETVPDDLKGCIGTYDDVSKADAEAAEQYAVAYVCQVGVSKETMIDAVSTLRAQVVSYGRRLQKTEAEIRELRDSTPKVPPDSREVWKCFHCANQFHEAEAAEHFGARESGSYPQCVQELVQAARDGREAAIKRAEAAEALAHRCADDATASLNNHHAMLLKRDKKIAELERYGKVQYRLEQTLRTERDAAEAEVERLKELRRADCELVESAAELRAQLTTARKLDERVLRLLDNVGIPNWVRDTKTYELFHAALAATEKGER